MTTKTFLIKCISHDDAEKEKEFVVRTSDASLALYKLFGREKDLWNVSPLGKNEGFGYKAVFIVREVQEVND